MTTSTVARSDSRIQQDVQDELSWTPDVDGAGIGVAVEQGTVTLSGEIDDDEERRAATAAVLRTAGVTTVVDDLRLHPASSVWEVSDAAVAEHVATAISAFSKLPDSVRASVTHHMVTLTGEVQWNYERSNARRAVEAIRGVAYVVNDITLHPRPSAIDAAVRIREALARTASLDASTVQVAVAGNTVTLTGAVRSSVERSDAQHAAWSSPQVTEVVDRMIVIP